jgi:hypothetical protein
MSFLLFVIIKILYHNNTTLASLRAWNPEIVLTVMWWLQMHMAISRVPLILIGLILM